MGRREHHDSWTCCREAAEFFEVLTHDDRDSFYIVTRSRDGIWTQEAMKSGQLGAASLEDASSAFYVTHNGFSGRKREANRCRQINAFMFDVDCHDGRHAEVLPKLIDRLEASVALGSLPLPNLFVETGRGVQLYYVLDRSTPYRVRGGRLNEAGLQYFKDIETGLSAAISKAIHGIDGASLDTCVYDLARVGRIPGTYNQSSKTRCSLRFSSRDYYGLADLKLFCDIAAVREAKKRRRGPYGRLRKFDAMLASRIGLLERLQELRGFSCIGARENMCFVYYNTATQLYGPDKAHALALEFNARFLSPLPESDIAQIRRTVDAVVVLYGSHRGDHGYYPLRSEKVAELLNLTDSEKAAVGFYSPARKAQREAAKAATRERRDARDSRICELYERGYTQAEVATKVGCSPRTVHTVLKRRHTKRGNLNDSVKSQFRAVLAAKSSEFAKKCQTSWVVKGNEGLYSACMRTEGAFSSSLDVLINSGKGSAPASCDDSGNESG